MLLVLRAISARHWLSSIVPFVLIKRQRNNELKRNEYITTSLAAQMAVFLRYN